MSIPKTVHDPGCVHYEPQMQVCLSILCVLQLLRFFFNPALSTEHQGKERTAPFCTMHSGLFTPHMVTLVSSITAAQLQ